MYRLPLHVAETGSQGLRVLFEETTEIEQQPGIFLQKTTESFGNGVCTTFCLIATVPLLLLDLNHLPPGVPPTGSDVSGRGEHVLLLFNGGQQVPPAAGASGPIRLVRGADEPGCSQEVKTGCVRLLGAQQPSGLQPQGVLCGRHAQRVSGTTFCCHFIQSVAHFFGLPTWKSRICGARHRLVNMRPNAAQGDL